MQTRPILVWFRADLRLRDNPALVAGLNAGGPVIPVFLWAPEEEAPWPPGAASRWWLHHSLLNLQHELERRKSRLIIRKDGSEESLAELIAETNAQAVFWNRRYEPAIVQRDSKLAAALSEKGIDVQTFNSALLFEPRTILNQSGRPFQVFSAFWKACQKEANAPQLQPEPRELPGPDGWPDSLSVDDLQLKPKINWAAGIRASWSPGEHGAHQHLAHFLNSNFEQYAVARDLPGEPGTSRLSPYMHFGELSPREVWHALLTRRTEANAKSVDAYLRELGWREFAYHLLFHFPFTANECLRKEFATFEWRTDGGLLKKWQRGETGYPLVDAGMRELWTTGWMHNRVRLIVASFLTKHLRIRWEEGAYWFWDTLVDADLANNTLGWQWTAGCGADAAPYFRIFNPVLQSKKFDAGGEYIRRWIPELRALPAPWIHEPWAAPELVLTEAGVNLGENYPLPIVKHEDARREALGAYERLRR